MTDVLERVKRDWKWAADSGDDWTMPPLEGPFRGDCEEFALAIGIRHFGSVKAFYDALDRGDARLVHVTSRNGNGHAVIWIKSKGYVDSIDQEWRETVGHRGANFDYSPDQIKRKLKGKTVRAPSNKKMLVLAGVLAAAAVFVAFGM